MRVIGFLALLSLAACAAEDGDHFPVNPGGGGGIGGTGGGSGSGSGSDGGVAFEGRVCLLTDMRRLTTCNTGGTGVLDVTLGGVTVKSETDGRFHFDDLPTGSNLEWTVEGNGVRTAITPFENGVTSIPVMPETLYTTLLSANGGVEVAGQGAIVVQYIRGTAPLPGVIVTAADRTILYDDNVSATVWDDQSTGPLGVAWIRETPVTNLTFQSVPAVGIGKATTATVRDRAITFLTIDSL